MCGVVKEKETQRKVQSVEVNAVCMDQHPLSRSLTIITK
jgi:hypothetical protein